MAPSHDSREKTSLLLSQNAFCTRLQDDERRRTVATLRCRLREGSLPVLRADDSINFGNILPNFVAIALYEAASHN
jgi:hypothetical protein